VLKWFRPDSEHTLDGVADLLAVSGKEMAEARRLLGVLGDPLRRVVLERVAGRSRDTGCLAAETGTRPGDIAHRLRVLIRAGVVVRTRDHFYLARPYPAACLRKYLDVLLTLAAHTHGAGAGGD